MQHPGQECLTIDADADNYVDVDGGPLQRLTGSRVEEGKVRGEVLGGGICTTPRDFLDEVQATPSSG